VLGGNEPLRRAAIHSATRSTPKWGISTLVRAMQRLDGRRVVYAHPAAIDDNRPSTALRMAQRDRLSKRGSAPAPGSPVTQS